MAMPLRVLSLLLTTLLAIGVPAPSPASAQQNDEVFVDPDSPAKKEYALPIDQARRNADPNRRPGAPIRKGAPAAPLFGAGIGSRSGGDDPADGANAAGDGRGSGSRGAGRSRGAPRGGDVRAAGGSGLPRGEEVARLARMGPPDAGGTMLLVGGAGGAILLTGIAAGLLLRRRRA